MKKGCKSMYLHIGKGFVVNKYDIIAIFNVDYIKNTKDYRKLCQKFLEEENIEDMSFGNPKTLILTRKNGVNKAYISNINSSTLRKRKI